MSVLNEMTELLEKYEDRWPKKATDSNDMYLLKSIANYLIPKKAKGYKVIKTGGGAKTPDGTTRLSLTPKGLIAVTVKRGRAWTHIGVVGGGDKLKGAAEAHLRLLGIEAKGKKLKGLKVDNTTSIVPR